MKRGAILLLVLLLSSCEGIFTTSWVEGLQRDISSLPKEAKIARAQEALTSSDPDEAEEALTTIQAMVDSQTPDPTNSEYVELSLLATDLSVKASGLEDTIVDLAETFTSDTATEDTGEAVLTVLDSKIKSGELKPELFEDAYTNMVNIGLDNAEIDDDQKLFVGVGLALNAATTWADAQTDPVEDPLSAYTTAIENGEVDTSNDPELDKVITLLDSIDTANAEEGSLISDFTAELDSLLGNNTI